MDLKSDRLNKAAKQHSQSGPIFGDNDIVVHSDPTSVAESFSDLDNSYEFPSQLSLTLDEQDYLLAGSKKFFVDDLEAFYYYSKLAIQEIWERLKEERSM